MGIVSIEHDAATTVAATNTRGAIALEHASPASVLLEDGAGDVAITSATPALVTIDTAATSLVIEQQSTASVSIDAASTPSVSLGQHDALDSLAHEINESSEAEFAYDGDGNVTRVTVWTSSARTTKVREKLLTYVAGVLTQSVTTQHDATGAVVATLTKTFLYDGDGDLVTSTTTRS